MNGKELFEKIYDDIIDIEDCIQVIHPSEENHYLMRDNNGNFDMKELIRCLLFKDYTFEIVKQQEAQDELKEIARLDEIARLESKLEELKKVEVLQKEEMQKETKEEK